MALDTKYSALDIHQILFKSLLRRELNNNEIEEARHYYEVNDVHPGQIVQSVLDSDEFFNLHREHYYYKLIPKSSVAIGFGPMGHELILDLRQFHMGFSTLVGHYEVAEARFVQKTIKPRMHVVDIGGNIGFFTTMFSSLVGPSGRVSTFEPVTETFMRLQAAVRRNNQDHNVNLYKAAASNAEGFAEISYPVDCVNMGGVSISKEGQSPHEIKERIRTVRLDDQLRGTPVDFIKIDVEGAELLAIQGAGEIIRHNKPMIMMEFNAWQLERVSETTPQALLEDMLAFGYEPREINHEGDLIPFRGTFDEAVMNLVFAPV